MIKSLIISLLTIVFCFTSSATVINLDFSNQVESNNTKDPYGLGPAYTGNTMTFLNVASHNGETVDAKVSASAFGVYEFAHHLPNYNQTTAAEPNGDIGFILNATAHGTGGLTYIFQLFEGTGSNSGSFNIPYLAEQIAIMVYDVDGETTQTETFRAFLTDGLLSYQTGTNAASLIASTDVYGNVLFTGPGQNYSEQNTAGAAILRYSNTSEFTLNFESETFNGSIPNGVFSAMDGDLSMGTDGFLPPVYVFEPPSLLLFFLASLPIICCQSRKALWC
jgi:hypothetical protein